MSSIRAFFIRRPVLGYYLLAFIISWGCILAVILTRGIPVTDEQAAAILPPAIVAMLGGPSLAAVLSALLVDGRAGLRELFGRLRRWGAAARWYVFALLLVPVVMFVVPMALSAASIRFLPGILTSGGTAGAVLGAIGAGIFVGFCEELGWTGFVVPRLRTRHGILTTGLIVGLLWGLWHIPANGVLSIYTSSGTMSPVGFLVGRSLEFIFGWLPAMRILLVWLYDRTGSLPLVMLMHAGATAGSLALTPAGLKGPDILLGDLVLAAAMWSVVAVVLLANRGRLEHASASRSVPPHADGRTA